METACTPPNTSNYPINNIIPKPVSSEYQQGNFRLTEHTAIYFSAKNQNLENVAKYLSNLMKPATGFDFPYRVADENHTKGNIYLDLDANDKELGNEGYLLNINKNAVQISANNAEGLFRGIQSLRQLLPVEIELKIKQKIKWEIHVVSIRDFPHYAFRGAMLDVSRHFFQIEDVKRYIDLIALYKMNILHLHLSDDQGWRIEIKSWPNLTKHGGSTQVGGEGGGFYTQDNYREIVRYAQERFITIIPEIDIPGHTNAALASYAELNCDGIARELYTGMKVGFSTLCTDSALVYRFVDDVVRELSALTPGPYFHIGGDESHSTEMNDYINFINRVQDIVHSHGKIMIGWDEIANADIRRQSIVQYWAKDNNAKLGAKKGSKVIMSPSKHIYLDIQYDENTPIGLHWPGYTEVDDAYSWNPETLIPGIDDTQILGIEAPLWTETVKNMDDIEYLTFPRIPGVAEIGWSGNNNRHWDEYKIRLAQQGKRFEAMNINFYKSPKVNW